MLAGLLRWGGAVFQQSHQDPGQLRATMAKWINETKEHPTDTLLLHDASGSVSPRDFALGQQAASLLIDQFGPETRVAVAQFASDCTLECPLTDVRELVKTRNQDMRPSGGDTKTELALQLAQEVMAGGRPGAVKLVFLITDGHPDDDAEAHHAAAELRRMGVQIIGIGIGRVSLGKLSDLCGRGSSFTLPNYDALVEAVTGRAPAFAGPLALAGQDVSFHVEGPRQPLRLHDAYTLRVEVRNIGDREIPDGSRLVIDGGSFFPVHVDVIDKAVMPGDTRVLVVELKPRRDATLQAMPENLELRVVAGVGDDRQPLGAQNPRFPLQLADFVGDYQRWQPPVPGFNEANVLVFGEVGAGKSTLINSLISLFLKAYQDPAISLGSQDHVTTFLAPYETPNRRLRLIDSMGLKFERGEPLHYELSGILEGRYPFGKLTSREPCQDAEQNRERAIHGCIVVFSRGFFSQFSEAQGSYELARGYIQKLVAHNIHPIVAVTQAERLRDTDVVQLKQLVEKYLGVHRDHVFLVDNNNPRAKALAREKVLASLLGVVLGSCDAHMKLDYDMSDLAQARRRSPSVPRTSSTELLPVLPERVQYIVLLDKNTGHRSEVYGDISPEADRLPKLRKLALEQIPDLGDFKFVNVFSGMHIDVAFEANAPVRCVAKLDDAGRFTVHIHGTGPPPYLSNSQ